MKSKESGLHRLLALPLAGLYKNKSLLIKEKKVSKFYVLSNYR